MSAIQIWRQLRSGQLVGDLVVDCRDKAEEILDELKRLHEGEDYYYRLATLLSAQKRFHEALEYARRAAAGRRRRFEVLAHLADILVEVGSFDQARQQIDSLDESYRIGVEKFRVGLSLERDGRDSGNCESATALSQCAAISAGVTGGGAGRCG